MIEQTKLESYLAKFLDVTAFKDYCPNGLIIEGKEKLELGISAVSFTLELAKIAVEKKVDFILVHHPHGFWKGQNQVLKGPHREKIKLLLDHGISLFAYHLPMDAHPDLGNNAQLASAIGLQKCGGFMKEGNKYIGFKGEYPEALPYSDFLKKVEQAVGKINFEFPFGPKMIKNVALCTGSAPNQVEEVLDWADVYITGEARENTQYMVQEGGVHFLAAGHHQTERFGPKAIGKHIAELYNLDIEFIDLPNPV